MNTKISKFVLETIVFFHLLNSLRGSRICNHELGETPFQHKTVVLTEICSAMTYPVDALASTISSNAKVAKKVPILIRFANMLFWDRPKTKNGT